MLTIFGVSLKRFYMWFVMASLTLLYRKMFEATVSPYIERPIQVVHKSTTLRAQKLWARWDKMKDDWAAGTEAA